MPYYLAPYIGAGTRADPYRPLGSDQPGWRAIDIRPDPSRADGGALSAAILYLPEHDPDPRLWRLADSLDEQLSATRISQLRSRLGVADPGHRDLRLVICRLLTRPPVDGWRPLRPMLDGSYEVWLDGLIARLPAFQAVVDNFNRADETPLGSPWIKVSGSNVNLANQRLEKPTGSNDATYYYPGAAPSGDQRSSIRIAATSSLNDWGPCLRVQIADSSYHAYLHTTYDPQPQIGKRVFGAYTLIATYTLSPPTGVDDVIGYEVEGSTLRAYVRGSLVLSATDTSITGGQPGWLYYAPGGALDDWEGGDLGGEMQPPQLVRSPIRVW